MGQDATKKGRDDAGGGGAADPTMTAPAGKPGGENVPPAGGESMAPADSKHPYPAPGGAEPSREPERR